VRLRLTGGRNRGLSTPPAGVPGGSTTVPRQSAGRFDETFVYGGQLVHAHLFRSALGRRGAIVEYQVRQTPSGAAVSIRCQGPVECDHLRRELKDCLAQLGLERPEVTIKTVDHLRRDGGPAKLKRFFPLPTAGVLQQRDGSRRRPKAATLADGIRLPVDELPPERWALAGIQLTPFLSPPSHSGPAPAALGGHRPWSG
jgi:hypothetical protein